MNTLRYLSAIMALAGMTCFGQDSCSTAAPFTYDCENFGNNPLNWPDTVDRCYTFTTGGSEAYFNFLITQNCSDLSVTYTLLSDVCDTLGQNNTGNFSLTPDVSYVLCVHITCNADHSIKQICPFEQSTLAVRFIWADVYVTYKGVIVEWATSSERDSWKFEIYRAASDEWEFVGKVDAAGNSQHVTNYLVNDFEPLEGLSYYRIDEIDIDGNRTTLGYLAVVFDRTERGRFGPYDYAGRRIK